MSSDPATIQRRQFLAGLMKLLVLIGFIFLSVPFLSSISTNSNTSNKSKWVISIPLSELKPGTVKQQSWSGGDIWVYCRMDSELSELAQTKMLTQSGRLLRDPESVHSEQPAGLGNEYRSVNKRYFVFIPRENLRGCQVRLIDENVPALPAARFKEPCYGATYDGAGRIFKSTGRAEQTNLVVPEHVVEEDMLKIAYWVKKR